ncbi:acetyltransferase [Caballeronia arvi]|uniref:Acetyltransferase n=1 Tax=Caballeronia arvi TaxID=1777135 RepID=A0A158L4X5_9BURK|nr:GNAT family N-acetyltransferase [Caballeronia arvi]SAL88494.1 acetyltransferase [Caballeronia arvi]
MRAHSVKIRRLRADEWQLLKDLRLEALRSDPASFWETEEEARAYEDSYWSTLAERLATPDGSRFLILEVDGAIIGTVFGTRKGEHEYRVGGLWIAPALRGEGYGSRLVQQVIEWATADPAAIIQLWCHVGPQTAFYAKNGFHSLDIFRTHESDGRQIVEMQWSCGEDG